MAKVGFLAFVLCLAGTPLVSGLEITADSQLGDWGVSVPNVLKSPPEAWTPALPGVRWVVEDNAEPPEFVGPSYGGQNFDAEAMYIASDATHVAVAVVTGLDPDGELDYIWSSTHLYLPGALFLDYASDGVWDLAIRPDGSAWTFVAGREADWWVATPSMGSDGVLPFDIRPLASTELSGGADPVLGFSYVDAVNDGTHAGAPGSPQYPYEQGEITSWTGSHDPLDHNVIEVLLSRSLLESLGLGGTTSGLTAFWTMACGNDYLTITARIDPPSDVIPESPLLFAYGAAALLAGYFLKRPLRRKTRS